jgi:hypothetical protein
VLIAGPDGSLVSDQSGIPPQGTVSKSSGCLYFDVPASAFQQATMPVGTYQLQLLAGPSLTPVSHAITLHITAPATGN